MDNKKKSRLIYLFVFFLPGICYSNIKLEGIVYKQLFNAKATSIHQSQYGYIWLGTKNGLYRFDGKNILRVPEASLTNFKIDSIEEDTHGNIWAGGTRGVFKVNQFTLASTKVNLNCKNELSCNVRAMIFHANSLWIGTNKGLYKFSNISPEHPLQPSVQSLETGQNVYKEEGLENIRVYSLLAFDAETILIGTGKGLSKYNIANKRIETITLNENLSSNDRGVYALAQGNNGVLFAGGNKVLYKLDVDLETINTFQHEKLQSRIWSLTTDKENQLWIGSISDGLFRQSSSSELIEKIDLIDKTGQSVSIQRTTRSLADKMGNFWATTDSGIFFQIPKEKQHISYPDYPSLKDQSHIHAILKSGDSLYYSNLGKGLSAINISDGSPLSLDHINKELKDLNIASLASDKNKNIWIGTYNGVAVFSIEEKTLLYNETKTPNGRAVVRLYTASDNRMWVGGFGKLGYFKNINFSNFYGLPSQPRTFYTSFVEYNNQVIIGSSDGLYTYNPKLKSLQPIQILDKKTTEALWVTHLQVVDSKILVSTRNGLRVISKIDLTTPSFSFSENPLLFENHEIAASFYSGDQIFAFTNLGLIKFDISREKYKKLNAFEYNIGSFFRSDQEKPQSSFVANEKGISILQHHKNNTNPNNKNIVTLSHLAVDNKPFNLAKLDEVINKGKTSEFSIHHSHSQISLAFSDFKFVGADSLRLEYQLNEKNNWQEMSDGNNLSLQTLPSGNHELLVRGIDAGLPPLRLLINVSTPWWKSTLAKTIFTVIAVSIFALLNIIYSKYRNARIIQRNEALEEAIAIRTQEIEENATLIQNQANHLERLIKVKDELFVNLTHELKTPLSLIMYPLNLIKDRVDDKQSVELIELAELNSARLLRDINQLLDIDNCIYNSPSKLETHNLADIASFYVASFSDLLAKKRITLETDYADSVKVCCQPELMEKIIINLMSNLIKYAPESARASISIRSEDEYGRLDIANEGSVIPEEMQSIIFERFTRLEQHHSIFGTGIGLALVKQLAETQGGCVAVKSSHQAGTCFSVFLPLSTEREWEKSQLVAHAGVDNEVNTLRKLLPQASRMQSEKTDKPNVLVIEDNVELAQCLAIGLEKHFNVIVANDGESGLHCAINYFPDLVITDIKMPKKDGLEICKALKTNSQTMHIPVVILTANASLKNRATAWQLLADEFIEKPFDWSMLEQRILGLLQTRDKIRRKLALDYVVNEHNEIQESQLSSQTKQRMNRIKKVISENYHIYDFGPEQLASAIGMSKRTLTRQAKELIGTTPMEYIKAYRLRQSKVLLAKGLSVTRVSEEVGIKSHAQFSRAFKDRYGQSPSAFQKQETSSAVDAE